MITLLNIRAPGVGAVAISKYRVTSNGQSILIDFDERTARDFPDEVAMQLKAAFPFLKVIGADKQEIHLPEEKVVEPPQDKFIAEMKKEDAIVCSSCGKQFKTQDNRVKHFKKFHETPTP